MEKAYRCLSCSHKGRQFPKGACPACGSHNVQRLSAPKQEQMTARKSYRSIFCLVLWFYLAVEIYQKVSS